MRKILNIAQIQGDPILEEQFLIENQGLVGSVVRKFSDFGDQDNPDYMQVGMIGLIKAIKRFKPELGNAFSTYAIPLIMGEIQRWKRDGKENGVRIPRPIQDKFYEISKLQQQGKTDIEIMAELNIDYQEYVYILNSRKEIYSLDQEFGDDDDKKMNGYGQIASPENVENETLSNLEIKEKLEILKQLDDELYKIAILVTNGKTQNQIGEIMGVSQAQASRKIAKLRSLWLQIGKYYDGQITWEEIAYKKTKIQKKREVKNEMQKNNILKKQTQIVVDWMKSHLREHATITKILQEASDPCKEGSQTHIKALVTKELMNQGYKVFDERRLFYAYLEPQEKKEIKIETVAKVAECPKAESVSVQKAKPIIQMSEFEITEKNAVQFAEMIKNAFMVGLSVGKVTVSVRINVEQEGMNEKK